MAPPRYASDGNIQFFRRLSNLKDYIHIPRAGTYWRLKQRGQSPSDVFSPNRKILKN